MTLEDYFFLLSVLTPAELRELMKGLGIGKHYWGSAGLVSSYDDEDAKKLIKHLMKKNKKILIKNIIAKLNTT